MSAFVAVHRADPARGAGVPAACIAALAVPGALGEETGGNRQCAMAARRTAGAGLALLQRGTVTVAGDVRLDARDALGSLLRDGGGAQPDAADGDLGLVRAAYAAWGAGAVSRLRGDFSFVIWDDDARVLVAARDGLGVRPLYYAAGRGVLVLSNLLDAVRAHPAVPGALHPPAIVSFLEHGWNVDRATTTFASISRLPAGTMLVRTDLLPDSAPQGHWRIPDPPALRYRRDAEYVEHYRHLLDAAVRDRLHPDGTAILLSGGLDSTSLAATARRVAPGTPLFALTTRTRDVESGEESRLAATVARRLGLAHELRDVSLPDPDVVRRHTPEPYDDPGFTISCEVAAALAAHAPVVIEGEDGDALFAPPSLRAMARQWPVADIAVRFVKHTIRTGQHPYVGTWLAERLGLQRPPERAARPAWLSPAAQLAATATEAIMPFNSARPDAALWLTGSIWQRVHDGCDRAFHGVAIEYRRPLLDARLMEFVFAIPPIPWCQRKFLVRQAFEGELPAGVIQRRKETVAGSHKRAVRAWRERRGAPTPALHQRTAEFVDAARLGATLRNGGTEEVLAAWRALALDRWLRHLDPS